VSAVGSNATASSLSLSPMVAGSSAAHVFVAGVFASGEPDEQAVRIAAVIDPVFVAEAGWDPLRLVLCPPAEHPLLGRPICRAEGCQTTAPSSSRICASCWARLAAYGLRADQLERLPVRAAPTRGAGGCAVQGCGREQLPGSAALCRAHLGFQQALEVGVVEFLTHPAAVPLAALGWCRVAACPRQRRHPDGVYCEAHQQRLRAAWRAAEAHGLA
jgi:hypothetical protein